MVRTRVGYAGGTTASPTYHAMGDHTECLQVDFDPAVTTYAAMLDHFWEAHSPWRAVRGFQYRAVLLYQGDAQRRAAEESRAALAAREGRRVETPLEPLGVFTRAEDYHQKYALRRYGSVAADLLAVYGDGDAFTDSTSAARLNAYLAGYGDPARLARELPDLGLGPAARAEVERRTARLLG